MIISFEIIYNDNFIDEKININNESLLNVIDIIKNNNNINNNCSYMCYKDKELITDDYSLWDNNYKYYIFFMNDSSVVNINLSHNNNNIILPQVSKNTKIKQIKNIINNNCKLYYRNKMLDENKTLNDYL